MFIHVRLLSGFSKILTYKVPNDWPNTNLIGKIVHVPIQKRTTHAVVIGQSNTQPQTSFIIKEAHSLDPFPQDQLYDPFIQKISSYHQIQSLHFLQRIHGFISQEQKAIRATKVKKNEPPIQPQKIQLTKEQKTVTDFIVEKIEQQIYTPTVLHGVTGSGKTECYKKMIEATIAGSKTALLMLPEVTLALQFEHIMRTQLAQEIVIVGFHSATTAREKKLLWKQLLNNTPMLIIGVHLPILLPIANLGLIIVDEEHEAGYQEKKHPKLHSKEAALIRAHLYGIPIVLGSATPSITSLYNVKKRGWYFFQLKKRFSGAFPEIKTVFLSDKKFRRNFWISQKLEDSIRARLAAQEQAIIFLNRRGFSFFVQCKQCSFIFECPNCSVSLTLHNNDILSCHYCDFERQLPTCCPECKDKKATFLKKGIGTQQVVTILEKLFPDARIGRADLDTTRKKTVWQQTLTAFEERRLDILVGTQTITKGFHFPGVTLVGILWADLNLHFPIYNATESTLQQLIQVAGRAGRQSKKSTVIVQAMSDHPVFAYLNETDYLHFYTKEIENRNILNYPPHSRLIELELKNSDEMIVHSEALQITTKLMYLVKSKKLPITILGPAQPPVSKIKQTYIRKIYIKSPQIKMASTLFRAIDKQKLKSRLFYVPNPSN